MGGLGVLQGEGIVERERGVFFCGEGWGGFWREEVFREGEGGFQRGGTVFLGRRGETVFRKGRRGEGFWRGIWRGGGGFLERDFFGEEGVFCRVVRFFAGRSWRERRFFGEGGGFLERGESVLGEGRGECSFQRGEQGFREGRVGGEGG